MRFTASQYDHAIQSLIDAKKQLEPDGHGCTCCGGSGHQAFECGHNPLVAMAMCEAVRDSSRELHEALHLLAGEDRHMGCVTGPSRVVLPPADPICLRCLHPESEHSEAGCVRVPAGRCAVVCGCVGFRA